jgi:hypothetical protein
MFAQVILCARVEVLGAGEREHAWPFDAEQRTCTAPRAG